VLTEKMGMGLAISMVLQMLLSVVGGGAAEAQKQRQQQLEVERMRRGYHRMHSARCACLSFCLVAFLFGWFVAEWVG
jgi:hypothetical protein